MTEKRKSRLFTAFLVCLLLLLICTAVYIGYRYVASTQVYNGTFVSIESSESGYGYLC